MIPRYTRPEINKIWSSQNKFTIWTKIECLIAVKLSIIGVIPKKAAKQIRKKAKFNVKEIDYCSIDIEGGEYSILEKFDFSKYPIKVLSLENNKPNEDKYNLFLGDKGYKFIDYVGVDEIWYNERYFNFSKK